MAAMRGHAMHEVAAEILEGDIAERKVSPYEAMESTGTVLI